MSRSPLLEMATARGAKIAELYEKSSCALRCELGSTGARSWQLRRESGLALRIWLDDGRMGFAHADGGSRSTRWLLDAAFGCAARGAEGPLPSLPRELHQASASSIDGLTGESDGEESAPRTLLDDFCDPIQEHPVLALADRIAAAFAGAGDGAVHLDGGSTETAAVRTVIRNSLGGRAAFTQGLAVLELLTRGAGGRHDVAARPVATTSHAILASEAELETWLASFDADAFRREAARRTPWLSGGDPIPPEPVRVLLDRDAAAAWIRSWLLVLAPPCVETFRTSSTPGTRASGSSILSLRDEPMTPGIDGEGRVVRPRQLVMRGVVAHAADCFPDAWPMRRDSYRESPYPGPLHARIEAGSESEAELLRHLGRGFFVMQLAPFSVSLGEGLMTAEARGGWVEGGEIVRPVAPVFLRLPIGPGAKGLAAVGADARLDASGLPVTASSLLFEGADIL